MNSKFITARQNFNDLLIEMEHDHGTRDTCVHFMVCLAKALEETRFKSASDVRRQFAEFYEMFTHLKPRMAIIQHYLDCVLEKAADSCGEDRQALIAGLTEEIRRTEHDNRERNDRLTHAAVRIIPAHGHILVHNHSHTVLDALELASHTHKRFSVIVAEQESSVTLDIAKYLNDRKITFSVVPEYMLSSIEMDISCMLIGAVTLKHDMHFVVDAGTKAVVSEMNAAGIPVYLMLTTNKFSYWKTKVAHQTQKTVKSIAHPHADFSFERVKFSHDRLPLKQVTKVITEEGIFSPDELKELYQTKLKEYRQLHREIAKARCG